MSLQAYVEHTASKSNAAKAAEDAKKPAKQKALGKETQLTEQATQAGFDLSDVYGRAAEQYNQFMKQGMQSAAQKTPRLLQGAASFNAPGGQSIVAAEAIAPTVTGAQAALGMTGTDRIAGSQAAQQESLQGASEYAMSAMPHVMQQKKVLGYLDALGSFRETYDDDESMSMLTEMLNAELDPEVVSQVLSIVGYAA